jgi:hypothetical protein
MYVSFDDGDHWQSLMQNLPPTSYRDAVIKDNDLVVATYGRGFWVLDDFSILRQLAPNGAAIAGEPAHLFKPGDGVRVRRNVGADTPLPPEVPHALNPVEGIPVDYWLARAPSGEITLDVLDASGALVRHLSSAPAQPVPEAARPPHPNFWVAPPLSLPKNGGENRTNWDLRYDSPPAFVHSFEINANPGLTPPSPVGPVVLPGIYTLKLTVDGRSYTQTVTVHNDPRSPATLAAIRAQHGLQMRLVEGLVASYDGHRIAIALRDALRGAVPAGAAPELADFAVRASALGAQLDTVAGLDAPRGRGRGSGQAPPPNFTAINNALVSQLNAQENGDMAPTAAALAAFGSTCSELASVAAAWQRLSTTELGAVNAVLKQRGRAPVALPAGELKLPTCSSSVSPSAARR